MLGPSLVCCGGAGGLGSVKATHSGGSHPCVVNGGLEGWYGWVLKLLEEGRRGGGRLLLEDGDGICPGCPMGGLCLKQG